MLRKILFGIVLFFGIGAMAHAGGCHQTFSAPYVAPVYTPPVIAAVFYPVISVFSVGPSYVAPLAPPPVTVAAAAPSPCAHLEAELKAMRAEFASFRAGAGRQGDPIPSPPAAQASAPRQDINEQFRAILAGHCASCHAAGVADSKGKGQVLIGDKGELPIDFSPSDLKMILIDCESGAMPKGNPPLSAQEKAVIKQFTQQPIVRK